MGVPAYKETRTTYGEYALWDTSDRYELHDGIPILMSPSPNKEHQNTAGAVFAELRSILKRTGGECRAFIAPFDVVLSEPGQSADASGNVVQPDVFVVCDSKKITEKNCTGSPDLVIEILSPSTAVIDEKFKYELYERHKVKEYWIVHPLDKYIICYRMGEADKFVRNGVFAKEELIPLFFAQGESLNLRDVFD